MQQIGNALPIEVWVNLLDPLKRSNASQGSKLARGTGIAFSIATFVVLSTLFTLGIASFLMSFGVAAMPALIAGVGIAFTVGAFTELFFYAPYQMDFCSNINQTWQNFKASKKPLLGLAIVGLNAVANGVVAGFAIGLLIGVMVTAGAAVPPFGAVLAVAIIAGLIAAAASFMLGTEFWIKKFGKHPKPKLVHENDNERKPLANDSTDEFVIKHSPDLRRQSGNVPVENQRVSSPHVEGASQVGPPRGMTLFDNKHLIDNKSKVDNLPRDVLNFANT